MSEKKEMNLGNIQAYLDRQLVATKEEGDAETAEATLVSKAALRRMQECLLKRKLLSEESMDDVARGHLAEALAKSSRFAADVALMFAGEAPEEIRKNQEALILKEAKEKLNETRKQRLAEWERLQRKS